MGKSMETMLLPSVLPWQTEGSSENLFALTIGRLLTGETMMSFLSKIVPTKVNKYHLMFFSDVR